MSVVLGRVPKTTRIPAPPSATLTGLASPGPQQATGLLRPSGSNPCSTFPYEKSPIAGARTILAESWGFPRCLRQRSQASSLRSSARDALASRPFGSNPQCAPVATKKQVRLRTCPCHHGGELGIPALPAATLTGFVAALLSPRRSRVATFRFESPVRTCCNKKAGTSPYLPVSSWRRAGDSNPR